VLPGEQVSDPGPDPLAADVLAAALTRPATLGQGRLVCIDGPAGSGKTTLAAAVERAAAPLGVRVLHMDNVYAGWSGLSSGMEVMAADVVGPLRSGRPGRYRRYDWHRARFAEEHVVEPVGLLVVEGVGSGNVAYDDAVTLLVWVDAPVDVRLARAVARDGEPLREHWAGWSEQETAVFATHRTRERADLVADRWSGAVRAEGP
jgi:uridine kinase